MPDRKFSVGSDRKGRKKLPHPQLPSSALAGWAQSQQNNCFKRISIGIYSTCFNFHVRGSYLIFYRNSLWYNEYFNAFNNSIWLGNKS